MIVIKDNMEGVREYSEEYPVTLGRLNGRLVIAASNQGGYDGTAIDLVDLMRWMETEEARETWAEIHRCLLEEARS